MLIAFGGCGSPRGNTEGIAVVRDLTRAPDDDVIVESVFTGGPIRAWDLGTEEHRKDWNVGPERLETASGPEGLTVRSVASPSAAALTATTSLDADDVAEVRVELRADRPVSLRLLWATTETSLSDASRMRPTGTEVVHGGWVHVFDVSKHPKWRGQIRRLRLKATLPADEAVSFASVHLTVGGEASNRAATLTERPWKMSLDTTVRPARLGIDDEPWSAEVTIPSHSPQLRFVPGLPAGLTESVEFVISARTDDQQLHEVYSARFDPLANRRGGWLSPQRVSLSRFAGETIHLRFDTRGLDGQEGENRFVAWGSTQLVAGSDLVARPNVVLILLDTLRADHLSAYGYGRDTSPHLERWSRRATLFETMVAASPWTLPSHVSLFTGQDPIRHGANYIDRARADFEMLAEVLRDAGYETVAWTGGGYLGSDYGLHQGFDRWRYRLGDKETELTTHVSEALEWLGTGRDRPFLLFFHTYEVHAPYFDREPYYTRFARESGAPPIESEWLAPKRLPRGSDDGYQRSNQLGTSDDRGRTWTLLSSEHDQTLVDRYDAGIAYTDEQIGRLLERLGDSEFVDDTVVVLTSDHGEGLGDGGHYGHSFLQDFNLLVPLIISAPAAEWSAGTRIRRQVRTVDVTPTIRELVGLEPDDVADGSSLSDLVAGASSLPPRPAWSYAAMPSRGLSLRLEDTKYTFMNTPWKGAFDTDRLVDLEADPKEMTNILDAKPELATRLRDQVTRRLVRDAAGLWFRAQSAKAESLAIRLHGSRMVSSNRLKAVLLPSGGLDFDQARSSTTVDLPPGSEALLYAEVSASDTITIEVLGTASSEPAAWTVSVDEVDGRPWSVGRSTSGWETQPGIVAGPGARISLHLTGPLSRGEGLGDMSPELREQLKALGYIE